MRNWLKKEDTSSDLEVSKVGLLPILGHLLSLSNSAKSINFILESYRNSKNGNFVAYALGYFCLFDVFVDNYCREKANIYRKL